MPVRLKQELRHNGVVYAKGAEVDLDSLGLDQKSAIAEGWAEAVNVAMVGEPGPAPAPAVQTMDRKQKGEPVQVTTGTNRPKE